MCSTHLKRWWKRNGLTGVFVIAMVSLNMVYVCALFLLQATPIFDPLFDQSGSASGAPDIVRRSLDISVGGSAIVGMCAVFVMIQGISAIAQFTCRPKGLGGETEKKKKKNVIKVV